jgi:hypothetical protein
MGSPSFGRVLAEPDWKRLTQARKDYADSAPTSYDEVLYEVAGRIDRAGSIGKADIGALLFWKRLRADTHWVRRLHAVSDSDVRKVTRNAVEAVRDVSSSTSAAAAAGRKALVPLPGFDTGDAMASALLTASAPDRMAVYDRRVQKGLELVGLQLTSASGRYGRYMQLIDDLTVEARRRGQDWSARDVDLALFRLGG